ncbi:MAG: hypothetical protein LBP82_03340, partial [Candidatus Methanoplasma sp.]|nr:hypothetical protein [Candidatus Methanoplasma sp.]
SVLGLTNVWVEFSYGSDNLMGPWPDAVAPYLLPLVFLILIVIYARYAYKLYRLRVNGQDNENNRMILLGGAVLLSILSFILAGKTFSSQYLIWAIPFIVFMLMTALDHVSKNRIFILSAAAIILTQLNFAVNIGIFGGGTNITDGGMMIILARNLVMLALFAYVVWTCRENIDRQWRTQSPDELPKALK